MRLRALLAVAVAIVATLTVAYADDAFQVKPANFDPAHTFLVQSTWLSGTGCPTGAKTFDGTSNGSFTDPACLTGDKSDKQNQGLLLVKTGPTGNFAAATATLSDTPSTVTELGYDLRKSTAANTPMGSHCGAGAPRFNIHSKDGQTYFLGCNSPAGVLQATSQAWIRLRWGVGVPLLAFNSQTNALVDIATVNVKSISIVFDEGADTGPDFFGAAILDNIDVNGTLVGQGPGNKGDSEKGD